MTSLLPKGMVLIALTWAGLFLASTPASAGSPTPTGYTLYATPSGIPVSAQIQEQTFNPPQLISPGNNTTSNNQRERFSWLRPSPLPVTPLSHYDFYLDGQLFASNVPDNIINTEYYYYNIRREDNTFFLDPRTNLGNGYHTWKVVAYNQNNISSESDTWTFYIDSTAPYIRLNKVDKNTLHWDSRDEDTIPPVDQRYLYVTQNPLLEGETEDFANLQFTLLCPINYPGTCTSTTEVYNYPDGEFKHRFYNLIPNYTYTVYLSATDASNNSYTFPPFYLIFLSGSSGISPTPPIVTPPAPTTPTTLITPPVVPTAPPFLLPSPTTPQLPITFKEIFSPAEFLPVPPQAPTPPPKTYTPIKKTPFNPIPLLLLIIVFGLPTHLAMSQFGTATPLKLTHKFIFSLIFPFIGNKKNKTLPFTSIDFYDPLVTYKVWHSTVSDSLGKFSIPGNIPKNLYIKASKLKFKYVPNILPGKKLIYTCIFLSKKDKVNFLENTQELSYRLRGIPLMFGVITSAIALYFIPSYLLVIYLYLCLQAGFSEYYYTSQLKDI